MIAADKMVGMAEAKPCVFLSYDGVCAVICVPNTEDKQFHGGVSLV